MFRSIITTKVVSSFFIPALISLSTQAFCDETYDKNVAKAGEILENAVTLFETNQQAYNAYKEKSGKETEQEFKTATDGIISYLQSKELSDQDRKAGVAQLHEKLFAPLVGAVFNLCSENEKISAPLIGIHKYYDGTDEHLFQLGNNAASLYKTLFKQDDSKFDDMIFRSLLNAGSTMSFGPLDSKHAL